VLAGQAKMIKEDVAQLSARFLKREPFRSDRPSSEVNFFVDQAPAGLYLTSTTTSVFAGHN
jgi:hypothetical protein